MLKFKNPFTSQIVDESVDLLSLFPPHSGEITLRYGRIGSGKTYGATKDIIDDLKKGYIVYTNFKLNFEGYDERDSLFCMFRSLIFPSASRFSVFPKENLRYIDLNKDFHKQFESSTDAIFYLDEGHVVFDSYVMAKMSMSQRASVLHTRHFNRSINIISQRPTAIHVTMRANVNRFYKYTSYGRYPFLLFIRTEYQDMLNENVDEDEPCGYKMYFLRKSIASLYDSKYLRGDLPLQTPNATVYKLSYYYRFYRFFVLLFKRFNR